jgi:hypothetical protein
MNAPQIGTPIRIIYGITEYECILILAHRELWTGECADGRRISAPPEFWRVDTKEKTDGK